MCKICSGCRSIMNYDPYFEAEVCVKCGRIERQNRETTKKVVVCQTQRVEITRRVYGVMVSRG